MSVQMPFFNVAEYEKEYMCFMDISSFPTYEVKTKQVSLNIANLQGYDSLASASYIVEEEKHTITLSTNLQIKQYIIFHEFTHVLDTELYAKGCKEKYAWLSGFSEYHASQVELMRLLGANSIHDTVSFPMDVSISTIGGEKSVQVYINEKYQHAIDLFSRSDFPSDIATLKTALGVLFNYYGLRSICEMFSYGFAERIDNSIFLEFIPSQLFSTINSLMHGWLNKQNIENSMIIYKAIVLYAVQYNNLT